MTLHRPIALAGFADAFTIGPDAPTVDWGNLSVPDAPNFLPSVQPASVFDSIVSGAKQYYEGLSTIQQAQLRAQLAQAQGQAAVASAKAGGAYEARQAGGAGALPSPSLLLVAGLVLGAVFLLKSK